MNYDMHNKKLGQFNISKKSLPVSNCNERGRKF